MENLRLKSSAYATVFNPQSNHEVTCPHFMEEKPLRLLALLLH